MNKRSPAPPVCVLGLCLLLNACAASLPAVDSGVAAPTAWQYAERDAAQLNNQRWWTQFGSPQLNRLIEQARRDSFDVAAAVARVRQAQATAVIAGAPLLPEVKFNLSTSHQKLLRGQGGPDLDATQSNDTVNSFGANLSASYEVDFWGGRAAARDSALHSLRASASDQATVELTLLSNVADRYAQTLAARQREQIAELNLANARNVLELVQTRYDAGSATALELAQQQSLVASQQRQLPLIQQLAQESRITLAALLGQPVQALDLGTEPFQALTWPRIGPGVPSQLLSRRPDLAKAEAELAAAQADVRVARAAMLPAVTLGATFGSDAGKAVEILRSPYYTLTGGLVAPIFNNGRLTAERDKARARQDELLQTYRGAIINGFADVEKALSNITRLDQQRQWQTQELQAAQNALRIAESRYQAGAEDWLSVLDSQRTLYTAQDLNVQLRLSRLQASIALYKALGGGWESDIR
ncbi:MULTISPECIES: efflux transporter outer membrane subunit [Pseudomonas]|uniref:efflux transporter outer membrane subunit n=1 Tax=Pseudomonas TaxID=286 RepID=UPI000D34A41B|nr:MULTISPECIES: efflux transporter outer membrane subunit [Pseudomonas]MCT8963180.1 efflux transporter outer membrane subunit [Pseudomonas veronii]MCT9823911.1 efflux transporter outer membrane subunit [Pseudomonas veronii]NMX41524.1 efflux transporter outer membrane subunit [Pseudomonas veronii]NMX51613.1 efflux transporter outer membrane subunit [Pseudomonas veronii]PUB33072.1 NodT family efflux transporter outer membrane factor (OMF) lipoprotein [Pseudomonas sp. GV105]